MELLALGIGIVVLVVPVVAAARELERIRAERREAEAHRRAANHCRREGPQRIVEELAAKPETLDELARLYAEENFPPAERFGALTGALSGFASRERSAELMEQLDAEEKAAMASLTPDERQAMDRFIADHRARYGGRST